jgi:hypothetical protein
MSKPIKINREKAKAGGWTDEQIDAYEASVNGRGPQYDALNPPQDTEDMETMVKPNIPEGPWIDHQQQWLQQLVQ